jgi:hypothetical protein
MSIQFFCTSCGQPIEVDDEHAGKTAACPYCRQLVSVPAESTYRPGQPPPTPAGAATAPFNSPEPQRPLEPPPAGNSGAPLPLPLPVQVERQARARTFGNAALACTALSLALFVAYTALALPLILRAMPQQQGKATPDFQKLSEDLQHMPAAPFLAGAQCGFLFFAVAGLALGIVSVIQSRSGNWRGWVGLSVSGFFVLCTCGLLILSFVFMSAGLAA